MASNPAAELGRELARYSWDPLGYVLHAFPWGQGSLASERGPRKWQGDILLTIGDHLQDPGRRFTPLMIAVASGHGIGKSAEIAMIVKWALDTCADTRIVLTANTESQLLTKTMPEITKWHNLAFTKSLFKATATALISTTVDSDKSWRMDAVTWSANNTEAFAGLHNKGRRIVLLFDEASNIDDRVWEVAEGALTDEETEIIWIAFGNPTRNIGRFRECFGKYRSRWITRQIDSRTIEGTNKAYLQSIIDTYGENSDIAKVRVLGQFPSASSLQFIPSDLVTAARLREPDYLPSDPVIFGIDHARFGDDQSVLAIRQGRDARSRPWKRWQGANSMQIAGDVNDLMRKWKPEAIFIDAGGPNAGGVIDRLRQLNQDYEGIFEVNFGGEGREASWANEIRVRTANKRAEMWTNMRAWLSRGTLPDEQEIEDDLIGVEYSYGPDEQIMLEKKEHMKRRGLASPDNGDALALTFAEQVAPREVPDYLNPLSYGEPVWDRYSELPDYQPMPRGGEYDRY